jgi:hypothetical protein
MKPIFGYESINKESNDSRTFIPKSYIFIVVCITILSLGAIIISGNLKYEYKSQQTQLNDLLDKIDNLTLQIITQQTRLNNQQEKLIL